MTPWLIGVRPCSPRSWGKSRAFVAPLQTSKKGQATFRRVPVGKSGRRGSNLRHPPRGVRSHAWPSLISAPFATTPIRTFLTPLAIFVSALTVFLGFQHDDTTQRRAARETFQLEAAKLVMAQADLRAGETEGQLTLVRLFPDGCPRTSWTGRAKIAQKDSYDQVGRLKGVTFHEVLEAGPMRHQEGLRFGGGRPRYPARAAFSLAPPERGRGDQHFLSEPLRDKNPPFPAGSQERTTGIEPATLSLGS